MGTWESAKGSLYSCWQKLFLHEQHATKNAHTWDLNIPNVWCFTQGSQGGPYAPDIFSSIHIIETPWNMSTSRTLKSNMGRNSHTTATHRLQFKWHWNSHEICKLQHKEYHNTHSSLIPWATHMIPHCPVAQTHIWMELWRAHTEQDTQTHTGWTQHGHAHNYSTEQTCWFEIWTNTKISCAWLTSDTQ